MLYNTSREQMYLCFVYLNNTIFSFQDPHSKKRLLQLAMTSHPEELRVLIEAGADLSPDEHMMEPLLTAVCENIDLKCTGILVEVHVLFYDIW